MKNIIVYLISAVLALGVLIIYGLDLIGYGMSKGSAVIVIGIIVLIIAAGLVISKLFSRKLDSKDKEESYREEDYNNKNSGD